MRSGFKFLHGVKKVFLHGLLCGDIVAVSCCANGYMSGGVGMGIWSRASHVVHGWCMVSVHGWCMDVVCWFVSG